MVDWSPLKRLARSETAFYCRGGTPLPTAAAGRRFLLPRRDAASCCRGGSVYGPIT